MVKPDGLLFSTCIPLSVLNEFSDRTLWSSSVAIPPPLAATLPPSACALPKAVDPLLADPPLPELLLLLSLLSVDAVPPLFAEELASPDVAELLSLLFVLST